MIGPRRPPTYPPCSSYYAAGKELRLKLPGRAVVEGALAEPTEGFWRYLDKAPADPSAGIVFSLLHDVVAARAADLARIVLLQRVVPQDVPGVEARVVDPQRRAVGAAGK